MLPAKVAAPVTVPVMIGEVRLFAVSVWVAPVVTYAPLPMTGVCVNVHRPVGE